MTADRPDAHLRMPPSVYFGGMDVSASVQGQGLQSSGVSLLKISVGGSISVTAMGLRSVSDFIFLASVYEGGWPVLSLTVSSSHRQCSVSVLIIAELARWCRW